ncbi:MAG: SprB repeat-containing protein, partial [Chitinophagales bacterium]
FVNIFDAVDPLCPGDSTGYLRAQADGGSGGYIYEWDTNPITTGDSIGGLPAGTYVSIVTDVNSCVVTDTAILQDPPPLLSQIDVTDESCYNAGDGALAAIPNGPNPIATYEWSLPSNDSLITGLNAGEYYLTITDSSGCAVLDTATVDAPDSISVDVDITQISCYNADDGEISLNVSGGTPGYNYSWSSGPNTSSIDNLSEGWYTVTVVDDNNCMWIDSFEIINPEEIILLLDSFAVSCNNGDDGMLIADVVSGGISPFEYSIDGGANYQASDTFSGLTAGTYTVEIRDSNQCTADTTATIEEPDALVFSLNAEAPSCLGYDDAIAFVEAISGGTAPYTYEWNSSPVQLNDTAFGLFAGTYTVTITDDNACIAIDSIQITDPPGMQSSTSSTPASCFYSSDGSAEVNANG